MFKENTSKKTDLRRLAVILLTVMGAAAATVILCCIFLLTGRRKDYAASSDYSFLKSYIKASESDAFFSYAEAYIAENITEFEDREEVTEQISALTATANLTFARDDDYTAEQPVYLIYAGGYEFLRVSLVSEGKTLSGFSKWTIGEISIADTCSLGRYITVNTPHGALLTVNGIEIQSSYRSDEKQDYYALSEFEADLSGSIYCDRYDLGIFFLSPDITAALDSYRLSLSEMDEGALYFAYPAAMTSSYTITVPYGSTVKVNGIETQGNYVVETGIPYSFLTRFEEKIPGLTTSLTYQIIGLFSEPEIEVFYGGEKLEKGTGNAYRLPEGLTKTYTVLAPSYATVKFNGVSLGQSEITGENLELPIMDGVTSYAKDRPYLTEYTVTGLLTEPEITASDENGKALKRNLYHSEKENIMFSCTTSSALPDKDKITLQAFAKYYIKYMYSGTSGLSDNYNDIVGMTPSKAPAFTKLKAAYKTLYNADIHKKISYGSFEYLNYTPYSSSSFSCIVKVPFTTVLNGETITHEMTMEILYIYSGNIRRVINYLVYE